MNNDKLFIIHSYKTVKQFSYSSNSFSVTTILNVKFGRYLDLIKSRIKNWVLCFENDSKTI